MLTSPQTCMVIFMGKPLKYNLQSEVEQSRIIPCLLPTLFCLIGRLDRSTSISSLAPKQWHSYRGCSCTRLQALGGLQMKLNEMLQSLFSFLWFNRYSLLLS